MQKLNKEYIEELLENAPGLKEGLLADGMTDDDYEDMIDFLTDLSGRVKA